MNFTIGQIVCGIQDTDFEYATCEVTDVDHGDDTVEIYVTDHEFNEDLIGDSVWVDKADLTLKSGGGIIPAMTASKSSFKTTSSDMDILLVLEEI